MRSTYNQPKHDELDVILNLYKDETKYEDMSNSFYDYVKKGMLGVIVKDSVKPNVSWLTALLCAICQDAYDGKMVGDTEYSRLNPETILKLINCGPGHGKSVICTALFCSWLIGKDPTNQIKVISFTLDLAKKHFQKIKAICESELYKKIFPDLNLYITEEEIKVISPDPNINLKGSITYSSFNTSVTGEDVNTLIFDDVNGSEAGDVSKHQLQNIEKLFLTLLTRLRGGELKVSTNGNNKLLQRILVVQQLLHPLDIVGVVRKHQLWSKAFDIYVLPTRIDNFNEIILSGKFPYYDTFGARFYRKTKMLDETMFHEGRALMMETDADMWNLQYQQNLDYSQSDVVFGQELILNAKFNNTIYNFDNYVQTKEFFKHNLDIVVACDPSLLSSSTADSFGIVVMGYYNQNTSIGADEHIKTGLILNKEKYIADTNKLIYILEDRTIKGNKLSTDGVAGQLMQICEDWNPSKIIYESNFMKNFPTLYAECLKYCRYDTPNTFVGYNANNGNASMYTNCLSMRSHYRQIAHIIKYQSVKITKNPLTLEDIETSQIIENNLENLEKEITTMSYDAGKRSHQKNDILSATSWGFHYFYEKYLKKEAMRRNIKSRPLKKWSEY